MDSSEPASRRRSVSSVHCEDVNIPSPEREMLLSQLAEILPEHRVPASLWACLQVSDLTRLRDLISDARSAPPALFSLISDTCLSIPLRWRQRAPIDHSGHSTPSSTPSTPSRASRPKRLAMERDNSRCLLTDGSSIEVAHIFPNSMINQRKPTNLDNCIPGFWKLLQFFWTAERLNSWRRELFTDPSNPERLSDGCHNQICLSLAAHGFWAQGLFALKPLKVSEDRKEISVVFYWQPHNPHGRFDAISPTQRPVSSAGAQGVDNNDLNRTAPDGRRVPIQSGDVFTFRTEDPISHPLPSFALLDMAWHLGRVVSMSAAATLFDQDQYDDDDDLPGCVGPIESGVDQTPFDVQSWIPSPNCHLPQSDHSTGDRDSEDPNDDSLTTATTDPSPVKVQQEQGVETPNLLIEKDD